MKNAWLSAVALGALACATTTPTPRPAASGAATAPAGLLGIELMNLDGGHASLGAALSQRPTLVSFWAPWCEPCLRELPALERLAQTAAACGAAVLGVAVGERPESVAPFTHARHLSFPQFTDEFFTLADALGQRRIPAVVVFDGAGRLVYAGDALDARATAALAATAPSCPLR